ncbi:MAG TPA: response regulator [Dehalococcoidia bacterium]|nr:response regulator [Dehalococcoidia bacterium]
MLLAEDFPDFMERLLDLLAPFGLNIAAASNGADAIDYVRDLTNPLHLLITDLDMPKRTGWHVIEAVRKHRGPDVPIIMQTGEATYPWVKVQAKELGIVLIHKPDIDELLIPAVCRALDLPPVSPQRRQAGSDANGAAAS